MHVSQARQVSIHSHTTTKTLATMCEEFDEQMDLRLLNSKMVYDSIICRERSRLLPGVACELYLSAEECLVVYFDEIIV